MGAALFISYGSLVPLNFHPVGWAEAVSRVAAPSFWDFRIRSKSDWAANFLILVPTAYFARGFFRTRMSFLGGFGAGLVALLACSSLSSLIEFAQIFFPPRVPSSSDLLAQVLGAGCGIGLHGCVGGRLEQWMRSFRSESRWERVARYGLVAYMWAFSLYQLMPLDLTLSPGDLFRKWRAGRIHMVPFRFAYDSAAEALYQFATDMALWAPVCVLFLLGSRMSKTTAVLSTVALSALLEGLQLLVLSRTTDTTDIVAAAAAAVAVALLWRPRQTSAAWGRGSRDSLLAVLGLVGFVVWCLVVVCVFWYPFNFTQNGMEISARLREFFRVPLVTYFYRSEIMGLTEILRRLLWFAPLGVFAFAMVSPLNRWGVGRLKWLILIPLLAAVAFGVELAQVALPGKVADATDALLGTLGAVMGSWGASRFVPLLLEQRLERKP
ncbi:VanZ like family protein [Desulfacinum hydrothermale DSM 13146]|uniref:VanZ like family protein n=1 Tax=Desulfacinum hydrothermale DSM 13146 TaxID=1121390 RepID=A0A1W1XRU7_9BACT|nr:VanZ family protein [Desulfacinum hydrothermale]SMC26261.1 VanZ like family protein [Desulfacinum hydrothermale DSM 13146]